MERYGVKANGEINLLEEKNKQTSGRKKEGL
jgi:hypothetical protein